MPVKQKINVQAAIKAKLAGQSYAQIAKVQGVAKQTVHDRIAPILKQFPGAEELAEYKQHSADIFHAVAYRAVSSITDEDIQKASLKDKVVTAGIATDKARLISGQSTQNLAVLMAQACAESDD